jgi:hypothetical protein
VQPSKHNLKYAPDGLVTGENNGLSNLLDNVHENYALMSLETL